MNMGSESKKPRLEADQHSVKWITPWAECVVRLDNDGDLTLATSVVPCPVFTTNEWQLFCAAVNENINIKEKE
tara:strand:- start:178 stop:396 length:219 start_codon:yes stop_codon:yes gene_type:complete